MAILWADRAVGTFDGTKPFVPAEQMFFGARVHSFINVIDLAARPVASGDIIRWARFNPGMVPIAAILTSSVSLGGATIDLGTDGAAALFKAAGTFTTPDAPTLFMKGAAAGVELTTGGILQSVIGAAALPTTAGAKLALTLLYTNRHSG